MNPGELPVLSEPQRPACEQPLVEPALRCFKLTLSYDGTEYVGWQYQINGHSIQAEFERALAKVTGQRLRVTASGRTDSGVHALAQVAAFRTTSQLTPDAMLRALNWELPGDIRVVECAEAPLDFHPIVEARRKRYRYVLHDGPIVDPFRRRYCWHVRQRLDAEAMHQACGHWLGTHDFYTFETSGSRRLSTVRTVNEIFVRRRATEPDLIEFEIEADGFLYNMVRTMTGTLAYIGRGKRPVEWAAEVLAARQRRAAGPKAPAQGLFLVSVTY
jgi:tRNA pseudouridine38-40 synthase